MASNRLMRRVAREQRAQCPSQVDVGREEMAEARPDISVLIATRNRAEELSRMLQQALARQETDGQFTYEVVVVDNGSTDHTRQVVEEARHRYPVTLRYLYEARLGKPQALNTGMARAWGEIFAITDDDALPAKEWLLGLWRCFHEERADGVGGRILPLWEVERPAWMSDEFVWKILRIGLIDEGPSRLRERSAHGCWVGGNMAIRRAAVGRVGGFDARMLRGQDTEYFRRCVRHGLAVCYEPSAVVYHPIGADRMSLAHYRAWCHRAGYYGAYMLPWRKHHLLTLMPWRWYVDTMRLIWVWLRNRASGGPWVERFDAELFLRDRWSQWWHRLALWPRWLATVATGRRFV